MKLDEVPPVIDVHILSFDSVSWKTAQTTGALGYMSYDQAQQYSDIYASQDQLQQAEQQAARDAVTALGPFLNTADHDPDPTEGEAAVMKDKIEVLQGQLLLVDSLMKALDRSYKKYETAHPE